MSPKTTRNANIETEVTSAEIGNRVSEEEIKRRVYGIYLERGEQVGRDLDDWLHAEQELQGGDLRHEQEA